ncbi:hypothetical protein L202_04018 [Cryptococcus amylolentus CBS 6039]|uniref:Uncharacterized protein n=1 Tax=Cryptococcus amylolentus CBS 6039 TaxID=1295533 RepID=A0A1E3HPU5_9TREE|nr:hypothetical protein L202_04018 [Cryptococcus amylolentus CBS 6039]ODN78379.1 hypothetical protein L202_04018 [Cryptococcus amylolentus CBS 6039]
MPSVAITLEQMEEVFHTNTAHLDQIAKRDIEAIIMGTSARPELNYRAGSVGKAGRNDV